MPSYRVEAIVYRNEDGLENKIEKGVREFLEDSIGGSVIGVTAFQIGVRDDD